MPQDDCLCYRKTSCALEWLNVPYCLMITCTCVCWVLYLSAGWLAILQDDDLFRRITTCAGWLYSKYWRIVICTSRWIPILKDDYLWCRKTTLTAGWLPVCRMTTTYAAWWLSVPQDDYLCCGITICTAGWLPVLPSDCLCCRWLCRMTTSAAEWLLVLLNDYCPCTAVWLPVLQDDCPLVEIVWYEMVHRIPHDVDINRLKKKKFILQYYPSLQK